jgi:hypothetical protein
MNNEISNSYIKPVYPSIFDKFCFLTLHSLPETINKQIQLIQSLLPSYDNNRETYFEIGCGEGRFTESIGKLFENRIVCEPNPVYCLKASELGCKVYQENFNDFNLEEVFDTCLCLHVLYYFSDEQIEQAIKKLIKMKKNPSSRIIISIDEEITGSYLEYILLSIEENVACQNLVLRNDKSVRPLKRILNDNKINFLENTISYDLMFNNYDDIEFVFSFFIMETKINHSLFKELDEENQKKIKQIIRQNCEKFSLPFKITRIECFISI